MRRFGATLDPTVLVLVLVLVMVLVMVLARWLISAVGPNADPA